MVQFCSKESWLSLLSVRAQCVNGYRFIVSFFHFLYPNEDDDTPKYDKREEKLHVGIVVATHF